MAASTYEYTGIHIYRCTCSTQQNLHDMKGYVLRGEKGKVTLYKLEVVSDYGSAFVTYGNKILSKGVQFPGRDQCP